MKSLQTTLGLTVLAALTFASIHAPALYGQESKPAKASPQLGSVTAAQSDGWRTIEVETTQATAPDVALTPDGKSLIFTMLGKLFRMPVQGGEAEQLTFGPYYDNDPAISPDGKLVAFQSDRDGSEGNIFVLTLATKEIKQVTREAWAERPAWAPDGRSLLYLQLDRSSWAPPVPNRFNLPRPPASVRRVSLIGGEPETIRALGPISYAFFLPDDKIAWTVIEPAATSQRSRTRIEFLNAENKVTQLRVFEGNAGPFAADKKANGIYAKSVRSDPSNDAAIVFVPISDEAERRIMPVSGEDAAFGLSPDGSSLYLGNIGSLWKVGLPGGGRQGIPLKAQVTMTIRQPTPPRKWTPTRPGTRPSLRTIAWPQMSSDGSRLVFYALGDVWEQPLTGGPARRLFKVGDDKWDLAFSPDWRQLAYVRNLQSKRAVEVVDLASGNTRQVAPPTECGYEQLNWSPHGELIAATGCDHEILAIDTAASTMRTLQKTKEWNYWEPYPTLSADGKTLFFQASMKESQPGLYKVDLEPGSTPELVAPAANSVNIKLLGQWMAHPVSNSSGIRLTKLGDPASARVVPDADGHEFSFTPDGTAIVYVAGNKLWRQSLDDGARTEIPIRFQEDLATPPPVLIEKVRVLDFSTGGFGSVTSILLQNGRIAWVGSAADRKLPAGTVTVDGSGRFAIPGLFDTHGHQGGCGFAPYISYGVTSVRNMGNRLELQNAHADRGDFTGDAVSRCFYAGRILEGLQGRAEDWYFVHPKNEKEATMYVRSLEAQGAQFIKLYQRLPWPFHRAAADEARRLGLPVVAHGNGVELSVKGVTLGYAGLTHWRNFYQDVIQMFKAAGTWWEPTMGGGLGWGVAFRNDPTRFRDVSWANSQQSDNSLKGAWLELLRTMHAAHKSGVIMLPGTDGGPGGLNVQWELEFYAEAGIRPIDVLRLATKDAAKTVGAEDHLGSLEPGKLADLILLDANPLEDIKNTQKIWRVFKGGWMFDPKILRPGGN